MNALTLPQASSIAPEVDHLIAALLAISFAVLLLVFGLMLFFLARYRSGNPVHRGAPEQRTWRFEIAWTVATLAVFFGLFLWSADLFMRLYETPKDALKIYVVGKQWMWKVEHVGGQREINALHIPAHRDIQLVMASEDVIHDFSVPAFRLKHDVLPGRYQTMWFRADIPGTYRLYCTQFCGADHAAMTGKVVVMPPPAYQDWLARNGAGGPLALDGRKIYARHGCGGCHDGRGTVRAPRLAGLYGATVPLADGTTVIADDAYLRDSILQPGRQVAAGYEAVMPSFSGQISEEDLIPLIAYIKSLGDGAAK